MQIKYTVKGENINKCELQLKGFLGLAVNLLSPTSCFLYLKSWVYFALEVGQYILHSKKQKPGFAEHLWTTCK